MSKKRNESTIENVNDGVVTASETRYSVEQLRNSLNVLGCTAVVFEGAVAYASKFNLFSSSGVTISEMKELINKWLKLPIK